MQYDLATSISVRYPTVQQCNLESEVAKSTMAVYQVELMQCQNLALGVNRRLVEGVEASHAGARQGPRLVTTKSRWDKAQKKVNWSQVCTLLLVAKVE
jgi:hypothetical protein